MPSQKKPQAVAYDVGHHMHSGLSFIHPHLGDIAAWASRAWVAIELLHHHPCPLNAFRSVAGFASPWALSGRLTNESLQSAGRT